MKKIRLPLIIFFIGTIIVGFCEILIALFLGIEPADRFHKYFSNRFDI